MGYVSREMTSSDDSSLQYDVSVDTNDGRGSMTTYVAMTFDNLLLNASTQLNNATLLLHNDPVIIPLTDVVNIYSNTSQILQIQVC